MARVQVKCICQLCWVWTLFLYMIQLSSGAICRIMKSCYFVCLFFLTKAFAFTKVKPWYNLAASGLLKVNSNCMFPYYPMIEIYVVFLIAEFDLWTLGTLVEFTYNETVYSMERF